MPGEHVLLGLSTAQQAFQAVMKRVFGNYARFLAVYLGDLCISTGRPDTMNAASAASKGSQMVFQDQFFTQTGKGELGRRPRHRVD